MSEELQQEPKPQLAQKDLIKQAAFFFCYMVVTAYSFMFIYYKLNSLISLQYKDMSVRMFISIISFLAVVGLHVFMQKVLCQLKIVNEDKAQEEVVLSQGQMGLLMLCTVLGGTSGVFLALATLQSLIY